jgi:protoporphyrinogen oxidase
MKKRLVVIGAGPAGLSAAYEVLGKADDWSVIVLESSPFVGGISRTVEHNGSRFDIGPHRFFSKSAEVNALWNRIMPLQGAPSKDDIALGRRCTLAEDGPDPEKTDRVMLRRHRLTRIFYLKRFFDYPISIKMATIFSMGVLRTWKAGWSYIYSMFFRRPEKSLEDFYINRFGRVLYSMFFEDYTEKLWGIHPSKIDPSWGAQRVKGLSLWKALAGVFVRGGKKETSLIDEFSYPKYGSGQFWTTLADEVKSMGGEIRLNSQVVGFDCDDGCVHAVVLAGGERIRCDAVFSSMPVKELVPALGTAPEHVARIAEGLPYRDLITVTLKVDKLAVKNDTKYPTLGQYIPDVWIYIQERAVRMGRLEIYNNFSPYMVDDPVNHVLFSVEYFCSEGDEFWKMDDRAFIDKCIDELKTAGLIADDTKIFDAVRIRTLKAYPAYFGTYSEFSKVREWLDSFANLYCIGRNGQHRYNNMDHSMLCGLEAAKALVAGSGKSSLWSVNTEEEYHETKK